MILPRKHSGNRPRNLKDANWWWLAVRTIARF
jgi:hypothetical protein